MEDSFTQFMCGLLFQAESVAPPNGIPDNGT